MIDDLMGKLANGEKLNPQERAEIVDWFHRNSQPLPGAGFPRASDVFSSLGRMVKGEFIAPAEAATSFIPTDSGFTGAAMGGNGWEYSSTLYNFVLAKNGLLSVGGNVEGNFVAGNGSIVINENGIDIGPGLALLSADGAWGIGSNLLLDTSNFDKRLDLSASGGYSALATGANGTIYTLAKDSSGNIYAGGTFTQIGGITCSCIAKWDGSSWAKMSTGLNGYVHSIVAVSPTEVYAAGAFTKTYVSGGEILDDDGTDIYSGGGGGSTGATPLKYLAKWDGTSWTAINTGAIQVGANNVVRSIVVSGTTMYAAGDFTDMFGTAVNRICSINLTTKAVTAYGSGLNATCYKIALSGSDVYAVGNFTGTPAYVGKYSGGAWSTPGSSPPTGTLYALAIDGSDVYVGGNVTSYLLKSSSGGAWAAVGTGGPNGIVRAIAIDGTDIIVGGDFTTPATKVAFYNGSAWTTMGDGVNNSVYSILVDTTWVIGGAFTTADGYTMYRISRYSASSAPSTLSLQEAMDMLDEHSHYVPLHWHFDDTVVAGATKYAGPGGGASYSSSANAASAMPAGSVRRIGLFMSTNMSAGTGNVDVTLYKNGSPTSLTFAIPQGSASGVYSSAATTVIAIAADDRISVEIDNNSSVPTGSIRGGYVEFSPS